MDIKNTLKKLQDKTYKQFTSTLVPNINPENIIGVRAPNLKNLAKQMIKQNQFDFLQNLPHEFLEENNLHSYIISQIDNFDECIKNTNNFLPYIDNWATCDCLRPKCFKDNTKQLLEYIKIWLKSSHSYTIRFAIEMLMLHFLDDNFDPQFCEIIANINSQEYYVNMMISWYFATALAKQYPTAIKYLQNKKLPQFVHNKTIQKATESFLIPNKTKQYLKSLKIKQIAIFL